MTQHRHHGADRPKTCIMLSLDFVGDRILPFFHCENRCFQIYHTYAVHNCRFGDYPERKQDSVCRHYQKSSDQCGNQQARVYALRRAASGADVNAWLRQAVERQGMMEGT